MIKAGYQLQITSSENDGDFYNTKSIDGLTKQQVNDWLYFLDLIKPFGNRDLREDMLFEKLIRKDSSLIKPINEYNQFNIVDIITDLIDDSVGFSEEGGFCRVLETVKIYYFATPVYEVSKEELND